MANACSRENPAPDLTPKPKKEIKQSNMSTIHSRQIEEVYEMPISAITRPLVSEVTEDKVCSLMGTLEVRDLELDNSYVSICEDAEGRSRCSASNRCTMGERNGGRQLLLLFWRMPSLGGAQTTRQRNHQSQTCDKHSRYIVNKMLQTDMLTTQ